VRKRRAIVAERAGNGAVGGLQLSRIPQAIAQSIGAARNCGLAIHDRRLADREEALAASENEFTSRESGQDYRRFTI
jgi:hypothetical protein